MVVTSSSPSFDSLYGSGTVVQDLIAPTPDSGSKLVPVLITVLVITMAVTTYAVIQNQKLKKRIRWDEEGNV